MMRPIRPFLVTLAAAAPLAAAAAPPAAAAPVAAASHTVAAPPAAVPRAAAAPRAAVPADALRAGAGQADITPPKLGYAFGGWVRADRVAKGQSTRLYANALTLRRGSEHLALVAMEVFAVPAGLQEDVAKAVSDLGYTKETVLLAASHTHSGPSGFFNNSTFNTIAPSVETIDRPETFVNFLQTPPADRQLYTFLVKQVADAIRRADADAAPAAAAWGHTRLVGLTQNRSLEAHLANFGIHEEYGQGRAEQAPGGYEETIDPTVDVLRVDKLRRVGRKTVKVPIGAYTTFADHGTVVKSETQLWSGDHHASAWRNFVDKIRKASPSVPKRQLIVGVYPNGNEGDMTAGILHTGIAGADDVGSQEADAFFTAWQQAGASLSRTPALSSRWTRACFCGRMTATGPVDSKGVEGLAFLTGSEEGRGPLYDITHVPFEGRTNPVDDPVQGDKVQAPVGSPPPAVPLTVVRIGDGVLASIPGEPTKEVGAHIKAAVLAATASAGVRTVSIAGLADDFVQYVTTPAEYGTQSYEGASTLYGKNEATFLQERLVELADAMVAGKPAPEAYAVDTAYGLTPDGEPFPAGADHGTITAQPAATTPRLGMVQLAWDGGPSGLDRPVDKAFVRAERLVGKRWRLDDSDLGLSMVWRVDDAGHHTLSWQVPATIPTGTFRLRVTANRYELISTPFAVGAATSMRVVSARRAPGGGALVRLAYPPAGDQDLRAALAPVTVRVPASALRGNRVRLDPATAHDAYGNAIPAATTVPLGA